MLLICTQAQAVLNLRMMLVNWLAGPVVMYLVLESAQDTERTFWSINVGTAAQWQFSFVSEQHISAMHVMKIFNG